MAKNPDKLLSGNALSGILTGPDIEREYVEQVNTPIDGSNAWLRTLSPFTFRIVLPDIYADALNNRLESGQNKGVNSTAASILERIGLDAGGEAARLLTETGLLGPRQSRTQGKSFTSSDVGLIDTASKKFDSFSKAQDARRKDLFTNSTAFIGGNASNNLINERFTAGGKTVNTIDVPDDGKTPTITNERVAADIAVQLQAFLNAPELTLLINPKSLSISYNQIQQFTERTRYGFVYQNWGIEQPTMSVQGRTGAFVVGAPRDFQQQPGQNELPFVNGVQFASKNDSASWQNLMNLFTLYKSNAYIYDTLGRSNAMHAVGSIAIEYDGWVYEGNFNTFEYSFTQDTTQNGGIEFSFEFTINRRFYRDSSPGFLEPLRSPVQSPSDLRWVDGGQPLEGGVIETSDEAPPAFLDPFFQIGGGGGEGEEEEAQTGASTELQPGTFGFF